MSAFAKFYAFFMGTALLSMGVVQAATWSNVTKIGSNADSKAMDICGADSGGAHLKWNEAVSGWSIKYRRINPDGSLGSTVNVVSKSFLANGEIVEADNGDLFVSWEDYTDGGDGHVIRSTNGGTSWFDEQKLADFGSNGIKFPELSRSGLNSGDVMMSCWRSQENKLYHWLWDGASWGSQVRLPDTDPTTEYQVSGMAWSPVDGSVWRTYGESNDVRLRQYSGGAWGSEINAADPGGFYAWPDVAVNDYGQVLIAWDRDSNSYARLWDPNTGWGAIITVKTGALLPCPCPIPQIKGFYIGYKKTSDQLFHGKALIDGVLQSEDLIAAGVADLNFCNQMEIASDPYGNIYAIMEIWRNDNGPECYISSTADFTSMVNKPHFESVAISDATLLADGYHQYQATLECSDFGGAQEIRDMRILFNLDFNDFSKVRGYLVWGQTQADVTNYGGNWDITPATGGGYFGYMNDDFGHEYILPVSAATSTSGNNRTVTWTFKVRRAWGIDGPETGNFFGIFARNNNDSNGWEYSNASFGLSFNVELSRVPDYDEDTIVDMGDFAWLQRCISGQTVPISAACIGADLDGDGDADQYDSAKFGLCLSAPGIMADYNCPDYPVTGMAPDLAYNPAPANGATEQPLVPTLTWSAGTAATSHDIYFGTTNPPPFQTNHTSAAYVHPSSLAINTTYFWRVDEVNADGTTTGVVWSFTTTDNPITNLNRYSVATFGLGSEYYGDRDYTITAMPAYLQGAYGIKTNNDDKYESANSWITFTLTAESDVYVVYDKRGLPANGGTLPAFLGDFTLTADTVSVTDTYPTPMPVFKKTYSAGTVDLAANRQAPATTSVDAMYFVIVIPTGN